MPAASDRLEFAPPPQPALVRAFLLALVVHLLLVAALTWGVNWKRESQDASVDAELWSSVPQQAAPKLVMPPPSAPQPVVKPEPKPEPPQPTEAEIALEKQKKALEAKKREEELERKKEAQHRKEEAERKHREEQKLAQDKRQKDETEKKKHEQQQAQQTAKARDERIRALQGMAGATGERDSPGTAQRSSGPSDTWAGRIRARVRPNIVFTDDIAGNPSADVEVRLAPDGTIIGKRLVKSSGNKGWDEAVLRALDKTEVLPRDTDGRVHSPVVIEFKPRT